MYCKECGKEIPENSKFCPECGAKIEKETPPVKEWYFVEDGQSKGVYSQEEMIEYFNAGRLNKRSFIWKSGLTDWCMYKDSELAQFVTIVDEEPKMEQPETQQGEYHEDEPKQEQPKQQEEPSWYYVSADNEQHGPYLREAMVQFFNQGVINKNTYVWTTGMADWVFYKNSVLYTNQETVNNTQPQPNPSFTSNGYKTRSIALYVILTLCTCGLFGLYWIYAAASDVNDIMRQQGEMQPTSPGMVLLLSIVTCGIYEWYWFYKCGKRLSSARFSNGFRITDDSIIMLILGIFGLAIVSLCILQSAINDIQQYGN